MANVDWLKELRAAGVKRAVFSEQAPNGEAKLLEVEFFPRGLIDISDLVPGDPSEAATDRPPPSEEEPEAPVVKVPPAMARVLKKASVS